MSMDTALLMVACVQMDIDPPASFHPTDPGAAQYSSVVRASWPNYPPVTVQGALTDDLVPPGLSKRLRRLRLHERELWFYRHTSLTGGLPPRPDDNGNGGGDGRGNVNGHTDGCSWGGGGGGGAATTRAVPDIDSGYVAPCNRDAALTLWERVLPHRTPYLHGGGLPLLHCLAASEELLVLQDLGPPSDAEIGDSNDDNDKGDSVAGAPDFAVGLTLEQAASAAAALAHLHRSFAAPMSRRHFPAPSPTAAAAALDRAVTEALTVVGDVDADGDGGDVATGDGHDAGFWAAAPPKVTRWVADINPLSAAAPARYACPRTVVHGEPLDAALRYWRDGQSSRLAAVVHWQQAGVASPATDVAMLFHAGLPPELRRAHEAHLLRGYWQVLTGAREGQPPPPSMGRDTADDATIAADAAAAADPAASQPPPPYECTWEALRGDYVAAYELTALRLVRASPLFVGSPATVARLVTSLTDLRKRRLGGEVRA
ncbi:hypothetical protein MMPV_004003 [Pyropia vietnamensis]